MTSLAAAIRALPDEHAATLADESLATQLTPSEHAYRGAIADLKPETDLRRESRADASSIAGPNLWPRECSTWHGARGMRSTNPSKT